MTSHELAAALLAGPDLPIVVAGNYNLEPLLDLEKSRPFSDKPAERRVVIRQRLWDDQPHGWAK